MQTPNNHKSLRSIPMLCTIITFGLICCCTVASSIEVPKSNDASQVTSPEPFVYRIEGRSDPFVPFITEKSQAAKMNEILPVESRLTGMQLFEPGQLTLVAIAMVGNEDIAMVEDTTGKGYVLRTGMEIGRRGVITSIEPNKVIIEETAFTRAGKKLTSDIVMLLKKEGEE